MKFEDAALLSHKGRFIDDLGVKPGILHAAISRSPHAHAKLINIDTSAAQTMPGMRAVVTRDDAGSARGASQASRLTIG